MDTGHWISPWEFNPDLFVGFTYRITHIDTGRMYIGKKFFWKSIKKVVKNRKNKKRVIKPSDWRSYTGSSIWLNSEIEQFGKDRFEFRIESLHESRSSLAYTEVQRLVYEDALRQKLSDGTKKYYNGLIPPIKYSVLCETDTEKAFSSGHPSLNMI